MIPTQIVGTDVGERYDNIFVILTIKTFPRGLTSRYAKIDPEDGTYICHFPSFFQNNDWKKEMARQAMQGDEIEQILMVHCVLNITQLNDVLFHLHFPTFLYAITVLSCCLNFYCLDWHFPSNCIQHQLVCHKGQD